jgi:hypothetical protein
MKRARQELNKDQNTTGHKIAGGYDVAVFRPINTRHVNLLTNSRVMFEVCLTYSRTLATLRA